MDDKEKINEIVKQYREYLQTIRKESKNENEQPIKKVIQEYAEKIKKINESIRKKDEEVEAVINKIKDEYNDITKGDAVTEFTEGGCYYFAYMLKQIFPNEAQIYTCTTGDIHAIVKINGSFYDARGNINKKNNNIESLINPIKPEYYLLTEGEYFEYFKDICNSSRKGEMVRNFEQTCDRVLEKVKNEIDEEKNQKVL
ncbi:MAG: hypothetical protein J6J17_00110 [Bacilli bacterium]|nr:hypothetical protein [Bacilli bacterium]